MGGTVARSRGGEGWTRANFTAGTAWRQTVAWLAYRVHAYRMSAMPGTTWFAALLILCAGGLRPPVAVSQQAHAHNDYRHPRPLHDALDRGFSSIEADVFLVDGKLLVAHHRDSVDATRTLESLYLAPLRSYAQLPGAKHLQLLIDVKKDAEGAYAALDSLLRRYADVFTIFAGDATLHGPVTAVISGERAITTMRRAAVRFAAVDGRLPDLGKTPSLIPLISDNWEKITKWKGDGPVPPTVRAELGRVVKLAHANGQRVRFWATPDLPAVWEVLADAGVDYIGADDLDALRHFLARQRR